MSKYTKGPWIAYPDGSDAHVKCPDGRKFIIGDVIYHEENKANAQLIAAAPDMAEALVNIVNGEPDYHANAMGCGLEDHNITDRYDAMKHGWDCAMERMYEMIGHETTEVLKKAGITE